MPIVLRDNEDLGRVLDVVAVGGREALELGRGLIRMLGQALKGLLANAR